MPRTIPTVWQALTLEKLISGWELIIGEFCDTVYEMMLEEAKESKRKKPSRLRIYWRENKVDRFGVRDTIECCPGTKMYQMKFMENYNWVVKTKNGWVITDKGREAYQKYRLAIKNYSI